MGLGRFLFPSVYFMGRKVNPWPESRHSSITILGSEWHRTRGVPWVEASKQTLIDKVGAMGAYRIAKLLVRGLPRVLVYHRFGHTVVMRMSFDAQMKILRTSLT